MLTFEQVKKIVESPVCEKIEWARAYNNKLLVHVEGVGTQDYLSKINGYENESQFKARKDHAISNKFLTEELLRPVDNAFNARGGSKNYKFKGEANKEEFIEKLTNVRNNTSLTEYINSVWFNKFVTDPNGLIMMEIQSHKDGEELPEEDKTIEPTYKSIHSIRAYEQDGMFVKWVIFEPHLVIKGDKKEDGETELFWVVDEESYYLYEKNKEGLSLKIDPIPNSFEQVPAVLCSNIIDNVTGWKRSPIDSQVELLNKYLVSNSVLSIVEFFHNYPQQWAYVPECNICNGTGTTTSQGSEGTCLSCEGTGKRTKKDVTDTWELKIPEGDQTKIAPDVAGYIYMPTEPWNLMVDSLKRVHDLAYFSQWGTLVSKDSKNETATGRFLDAQPVNNRLELYSKTIEKTHTALANFIGQFYYPETFDKAIIQYGRRYLIETPDQIWDKYIKAKTDNAPVSTLDLLLSQYLESEFRENEQLFVYEIKKVKLEPFVHWDILTVKDLGVGQDDYSKKLYFSDWIQTKTIKEVIDGDINKLNEELTAFSKEKMNGTINNQNNTE